jgi:thiol-disulfide isomerase/thioredoxin
MQPRIVLTPQGHPLAPTHGNSSPVRESLHFVPPASFRHVAVTFLLCLLGSPLLWSQALCRLSLLPGNLTEWALPMRKALLYLTIAAICGAIVFHFYHPDFSWMADASDDDNGPITDFDQPLPHTVLAPVNSNDWVDLSTYRGQVVLLAFWTTWCSGCVDEVPSLIHLQQEFSAKGFTVVAIAVDDEGEESVESFVKNQHFPVSGASAAINYPVFLGSDEIARKLGFEGGLPAGVLINRDGREVKIIRGTVSEAALSKAIRRLL